MRFIHIADLHLGIPLNEHRFHHKDDQVKRRLELEDAFYRLLEKAPQEADFIIITGDTFDKDGIRSYYIDRFLNAAKNSKIPIIMIAGNHDDFILSKAYLQAFNEGPLTLLSKTNPTTLVKDVQIDGFSTLDYDLETVKKLPRLENVKHRILCLHGDILNKADRFYLSSKQELEQLNYDYIGLGHIHKHEFVSKTIAYSGDLEPHDFSERGPKGYILGDLNSKTFNLVKFASRQVHRVKITCKPTDHSSEWMNDVLKEVPSKDDFVRVILNGEKSVQSEPIDNFKSRLQETYFVSEVKDKRRMAHDLDALKKLYPESLIEVLIDESDDLDVLYLALEALLESEGHHEN